MDRFPPSIFNDVIGPVMRGPSSSHVAGAARIAAIVRQAMKRDVKKVVVDFDINGSLAESHDGHGTDMGFITGILGMSITDQGVENYKNLAARAGVEVDFRILDYGAVHPNNYRIHAADSRRITRTWEAVSVGGGMIEMQKYDGFNISMAGDFFELLLKMDGSGLNEKEFLKKFCSFLPKPCYILKDTRDGQTLYELKFDREIPKEALERLCGEGTFSEVIYIEPILPTRSVQEQTVPFLDAAGLLEISKTNPKTLWEFALLYESCRGGTSEEEVFKKMDHIIGLMEKSIDEGLKGTEYKDRILGFQSYKVDEAIERKRLVPCDPLNRSIKYITAIMEVKSSMGVIVAAPTAGSCGCLPGTLFGVGSSMGMPREDITKAMLAAGIVGVFIARSATFAAEVAGCQVECGAGSSMAAAGIAQMLGGTVAECLAAASVALQNVTGLACDPVANRVEVPCLGKNIMGASNAIASANMAMAGYDQVIPLDQTICAVYDIGLKLPLELRCTLGGLGKTKAAAEIRSRLES